MPVKYTAEALAATVAGKLPSNAKALGMAAQAGKKAKRERVVKIVALPPSTYDAVTGTCTVVLPLPPMALRPNGRPGKWDKIKAVAQAREMAAYTTAQALKSKRPGWTGANVFLTVYLTSRRGSDTGNWIASCKAHEDGIADAGLVMNDSGNVWQPVAVEADRTCPRIELTFQRIDQ